jgi:hypothetical protein
MYCGVSCSEVQTSPVFSVILISETKLELVEAKSFVPLIMGTWDEWSQWCNRLRRTDGPVAGFVLWKEVAAREKEEGTRLAREDIHGQRAGRLFVSRQRHTQGAQPPQTHILPNVTAFSYTLGRCRERIQHD